MSASLSVLSVLSVDSHPSGPSARGSLLRFHFSSKSQQTTNFLKAVLSVVTLIESHTHTTTFADVHTRKSRELNAEIKRQEKYMNNTGNPATVNISTRAVSSTKVLLKRYGIKDSTKNEAKLV